MPMTPNQEAYIICMERGHTAGGIDLNSGYPPGAMRCEFCGGHYIREYVTREIDTPRNQF